MATLSVHGLVKRFDAGEPALRDVSFAVEQGRTAALLGPSGCGKTTVLRLIAGLDAPDDGDVRIDGESVLDRPPHRRGLGLMFQELALFPHLDVRQNIEFGLRMARWPREQRAERVSELLALVGLEGFGRRGVHELSGGERQRVALARTLAPQPRVLLLDEPLGSLDETLKQELRTQLRAVLRRLETTALIVSHDLRDAVAVADDLILMDRGELLQAGATREVLARPASVTTARMTGYVTIAEGAVEGGRVVEGDVGAVALPEGLRLDGRGVVMAHPSSLLGAPLEAGVGCGVSGAVVGGRPDGPASVLEVALTAGRRVAVRWEWDVAPPVDGTVVALAARPGTLRFFHAEDGRAAG